MTDQQVQLFLADLAIIILLARLLGIAAKRLGQPPVLGEIIAGILLGPTLFHGKITATLFPITLRAPLSALANLGVVMFMFAVGYLLDLRLIRGRERVAASVSVSSIILPLSLGVGLGAWLASRHHVHHVLPFALFVGTAMSVTAFPVLARILTDRNMHRTRIGSIALASAATDDVLAWSLLAVVVAIAGAGSQQFRLLLVPVYAGVMFGLVRPSLTPSCWARAEPSARRSQPTGPSSSSRSCAACRKRPARSRPGGREGREGSRRPGRRATGGRGPAEAGDQSGRRPAREPSRRAHQGWHRRQRRPAAFWGTCRRCRRR